MKLDDLNKLHDLYILNLKEEKDKVVFYIGNISNELKYILSLDINENFNDISSIKTFYYDKGNIIGKLEDDYKILNNHIIQIIDVAICTPNDLIIIGKLCDLNKKLIYSPNKTSINIIIRITRDISTTKSVLDYVKLKNIK